MNELEDTFGRSQVYIPTRADLFCFEWYEHARSEGIFRCSQVYFPTRSDLLCNRKFSSFALLAGGHFLLLPNRSRVGPSRANPYSHPDSLECWYLRHKTASSFSA